MRKELPTLDGGVDMFELKFSAFGGSESHVSVGTFKNLSEVLDTMFDIRNTLRMFDYGEFIIYKAGLLYRKFIFDAEGLREVLLNAN